MQRGRDSRLDSPGMCSKLNFQNLEPGLGVDTVPLLVRFHGQCRRMGFCLTIHSPKGAYTYVEARRISLGGNHTAGTIIGANLGQCRRLNAFWLSLQDSCFRTPSCHSKRLSPILSLDIWDTLPRRQMYKGAREMSSQGWR
jgi:hypothetical protein